jgi:hypothetical protein
MRILIFILCFLPTVSFAQKTLGRESFMVSVRPILNGILGDFYQMVVLFPDFPRELIPLIQELDSLTIDKETLRETCPRIIDVKCKDTLNSLREKLIRVRNLSMNLLVHQKMSQALAINSLAGQRFVTEFDTELEEIKGYLDNSAFMLSAKVPQKRETYFILKELDELNTILSLSLVEYIPFAYRDDFRNFYTNFVQPIQQQISKNKNYEFFNRNVNALNFSINLLNQNLTKRNKKTPEGMAPFLSVIHNRWNSILRYYF